MKHRRVAIIYKKSVLQLYVKERKDPEVARLVRMGNAAVRRLEKSHELHQDGLRKVQRMLRDRDIDYSVIYRARVFDERRYDLIMSVGGDGTFLEAARAVKKKPILGVNSNPQDSVGYFCGANPDTVEDVFDNFLDGRNHITELSRLSIQIGKKKNFPLVLNDLLVTNSNPAATSRYLIQVRRKQEDQKSSGIWISPAAGSTAAMKSAGRKPLALSSSKFQYCVRELYAPLGLKPKLKGDVLSSHEQLIVISKMRQGRVYFDGSHVFAPFTFGQKLVIRGAGPVLKVVGPLKRSK